MAETVCDLARSQVQSAVFTARR